MECDQADVCVFIVGATDPHGSNGHVDRIRRSASRRKGKASSADERRIRAKDVLIKKNRRPAPVAGTWRRATDRKAEAARRITLFLGLNWTVRQPSERMKVIFH